MPVTVTITGDATGLTTAFGRLEATVDQRMSAVESRMASGERATQQFSERSAKHLQSLEASFTKIQSTVTRVMGVLASIGVGISLGAVGKQAVDTAANFEQLDTQLKFVVKSMAEFQQARQFILQFTATTPLQLGEVTKAFIDLTRRGFDVQRTMKAVADVSSLQLDPSQNFQHIIFQLGQIADRAKLTGDNLKDLSTSGVSIGRVTEELRKMGVVIKGDIGDASISAAKGIEAITRVLEEDFRDATLATAGNWKTLVSNLQDTWGTFQDFVVRGPILDFLKGLVSIIGNELTRAVKEDQQAFQEWGATAVKWMQTVILNVAGLVDALSLIASPIIAAGRALYTFAQQFDVFTNDLMARMLSGTASALEALFAPDATVQGLRKAAEAIKGKGTGDIFLKSVLPTEGETKTAVTSIFTRIEQETARLQGKQDEIIRQRQAENAKKQQKLSEEVLGGDGGKGQTAENAAAKRAKAEEDILAASLKVQEALIQASFDERRQIVDAQAAAALQADQGNVRAIAAQRLALLKTMATEEARDLEALRLASVDQQLAAQLHTLDLEKAAHAGKVADIAKIEAQQTKVTENAAAKREEIMKQTGEVTLGISKKTVDEQIKLIEAQLDREAQARQKALQGRASILTAETELVQAQVDGLVLTEAEGLAQRQALERQALDVRRMQLEESFQDELRKLEDRVAANAAASEEVTALWAKHGQDLQVLNLKQQTENQRALNEQKADYERFAKSISDPLAGIFEGLLDHTLNLVESFKRWFLRTLAKIAAYAATHAIIIPIITSVLGGLGGTTGGMLDSLLKVIGLAQGVSGLGGGGGAGGGGFLDTGGQALAGVGLAKQLFSYLGLDSLTNYIGTGLSSLKETFLVGIDSLFKTSMSAASQAAAEAAEFAATGSQAPGGGAAAVGASQAGNVLGIAGGLAALGSGIYGALNASNNAAKAAYAASAAAGAAAATSAALVSAGVIAAGTGWTGVGLIAAAAAAVIGTVLNMVLKPAGPNLAVGQPAGVDVGVEGGKLVRRGGATSNIIREEGVSPEQTSGVQKALNEGINAAVASIVQTINAVALDPAKLLGPTQDALRFALSEVQTINSASARHMEKDIAEQLKFTQTAIVSNMLEPINLAFEQLIDSDLETQLNRLPGTTTGLVDIFKTLNTQLDEMAKGENRDVLGQIQGVREAVARFGNRLAQTAGRTAEQIVNGVIDEFTTMTTTLPALQELSDAGQFSEHLGTFITALNEAMSGGLQALATLKKTQETLTAVGLSGEAVGTQVGRLITAIGEQSAQLSEQIVTMMTMTISELKGSADPGQFSQNLGTFITTLNTMVSGSLQALATLKATQQALESFGLSGAAVGAQVGRLMTMIGEQSARLSEQIVIGSLKNLADALQTVVVQPIRLQATTVDSLFTDSLAALNELWLEMQRLDQVGIDTTRIKEQFTTLLGGVLESAKTLLTAAVQQGTFPEFLDVLLSIPDALAKLNPVFERLKALGQAFASVVGPNQQAIAQGEEQLRTPAERMARTAEQMHDLELAIADAGTSAEKALPLYAQLGQAIQANAAAQIDAVQQVGAVIEQITSILETRRTTSERLAQINQRINTAPGGGQGSIENISTLVTLYGQQLDLLAQLMDTIDAGLSSIDETLRAGESVSLRAARLVGATAQPPEVPGKVRALTAEELLQQAGALQDAIGAVRELIDVIEQGLQNIQDILHANETINERATRLLTEVTTGPQPQTVEGLIQLSTGLGDALGAIRALIDLIQQGLQQIQDIMHANETATQRAIRLVAAVPSAQGVTDPAALITMAGQIGEAITAVRAVIDLLQSGIDSIDQTLFSLLSITEQAVNLQAKIAAVNTEIATAGKVTPEQLIKLVGLTQQALSVQQQITKSLEATLEDLKSSFRTAGPPIEQIASTRTEIASLQQLADTGQATPEQLQKLVDLNQELLGLGQEFDLLDVQQEALDSLKALAPIIQKQIDDSKLREKALVDNLVLIKTALESYLTVAQSTEAQLLTQLAGIQTALQIALAVAVSTETWLITQLTVIQQWLEASLIGAKVTEQQLVLQLLGVQAILQAQRAELAIAQAITIRYLDAQLKMLNDQLLAQYGTANVDLIIKQIQEWQLDELRDLNKRLKDLFFQQPQAIDLFGVQTAIGTQTTELQTGHLKSIDDQTGTVINKLDDIFKALDKPLVTVPKIQGGFIALQMGGPVDHASLNHAMTGPLHLARGGMVSAILEPGERVFPPPFTPSQTHALTAMNTEFPRMAGGGWTVPGLGSGDHVPALVPDGSFVLNRTASRARGYQDGGVVRSSESSAPVVHNHYYNFPNLTIRNKSDLEELKTLLRELERRRLQR